MLDLIDEGEHGAFFLYDPARVPYYRPAVIVEVGCFTLRREEFLRRRHRRVWYFAIEPDPENYRKLCLEISMTHRRSLWAFERALAEKDGPMPFYRYAHEQWHSGFPRHRTESLELQETTTVQGRTLRSLLSEIGVEQCDLLLLNCEGAEIFALEQLAGDPALRDHVTQISCGAHFSHVKIYPESRWVTACARLDPYYEITPGDHPTLPYFHFGWNHRFRRLRR
jgi:FkbM family methyltransferase